jgi:hypothetical protein
MADTFEGELDIIGFPKVTIVALKNFPLSAGSETRKDGSIVFCVETDKLYRWDADSTETADNDDVILSNLSGTGRWLAISEFVKNVVHKTGNETIAGQKVFEDYTKIEDDLTIEGQASSGKLGEEDGRFSVRRKSDGLIRARMKAEAKSEFPDGITLLPDGVVSSDAATVNQIDTHTHEDTKYEALTVGPTNDDTFTLTQGTPDLTAPATLTRNGDNTYHLGRGDFSIVGTTLTWLRGSVAGDSSIPLSEGDTLDVLYNIQNGTGTNVRNVTEKGIGLNVKHVGEENFYSSEAGTINYLIKTDDINKVLYEYVGRNLTEGTPIDPDNAEIRLAYTINELGQRRPRGGIIEPLIQMFTANTNAVRVGSTVTVTNPSSKYVTVGTQVFIHAILPGEYVGTWTITAVDKDAGTYSFEIVGTPTQPTQYGVTAFWYRPNVEYNNNTVMFADIGAGAQNMNRLYLVDNPLISPGYYFDFLTKGSSTQLHIVPLGNVKVRGGRTTSWTGHEWPAAGSPVGQYPSIKQYVRGRLYYAGKEGTDPIWYLQNFPIIFWGTLPTSPI